MNLKRYTVALIALAAVTGADAQNKLTGTPIGSSPSVDYSTSNFKPSTTVNTPADAFDGNFNTCYASWERSYTWVGLDLGEPHVITRVGYSPRNDGHGMERLQLGMFEGANSPDFLDAIPLYLIPDASAPIGRMTYADINCSRGVRYVRYVGPSDARCNIAELEFYGNPGKGDDSALWQITNIPTVIINTVNAEEPYDKEHDITSQIKIISENGSKILDVPGTSRLRGNASMAFPKKPYRIKFDKKQKVLDAPAKAKKWTLINNYGDKTLLRNDLAFEVARRLKMEYVPYLHSVDVVLNGEYKGNYQLCDQVEVNDGRVDITEMEPTDNDGDNLTGGYLVEVDAYAEQELSWFKTTRGIPVTIKSPDDDEITPEQKQYVKSYFQNIENKLWSSTTLQTYDYREIFDLESFLRHFLVGEISGNTDTYWSVYMYKERGNPSFYTGPVWDFDIAFENDNRTYPICNNQGYLCFSGKNSAANGMMNFVRRIIYNDPMAETMIRDIWEEARDENDLSAESLRDYLTERSEAIQASQALNFKRWPIMNQYVHQNPTLSGSYNGEVNRVKTYLTQRFNHLWNIIKEYESGIETPEDDIDTLGGRILAYGGEIALKGFGEGSSFAVYDSMGTFRAGGNFDGDKFFTLPTGAFYLVAVTDGSTGTTLTRKIIF